MSRSRSLALLLAILAPALHGYELPELPPIPAIPAPQPVNSVPMGNSGSFAEVKMDFPIASGPVAPTWSSIGTHLPLDPALLRTAKFGIWVHYGPQSAGQSGDWYARNLYKPGSTAYNNHLARYGHPSEVGYKDVLRTWNPTLLDPAALVALYKQAGARFLLIQGVHHDQFDMWNSRYQPWNSTRMGPNRDLIGEWTSAARAAGIGYGLAFHHEYSWWWFQTAFNADTSGAKAGIPYDGNLTLADGVGKWWEGFDPRLLYGIDLREYQGVSSAAASGWSPPPAGIFSGHLDYAQWYNTWWALRLIDAIEQYDPDFIYTDGTSSQPFSGSGTGTGYKSDAMQRVIAHMSNRAVERRGSVNTHAIVKFHSGDRIATTFENTYPSGIKTDQPWIGDVPVGDWFYSPGFVYNPKIMIHYLLECVSRDGAAAICISPKPDGSLDDACVTMLQSVGQWMDINNAGIYGSRAWLKYGEGTNTQPTGKLGGSQANKVFTTSDFRYTVGADGYLYAYCMTVPAAGAQLTLPSLGTEDGNLAAPITSVELLGSASAPTWSQTATDLNIICPASMPFQTSVCFKIGPTSIIIPPGPTGLVATPIASSVVLNWDYTAGPATYNVKRATGVNGTYSTIATGLTAKTFTDTTAAPETLYFYVVTATQNAATSAYSSAVPAILAGTTTWSTQDIGSVGATGAFAQSGDLMLLNGAGADIWGTADEFRYAYRPLSGDGTLTAKVEYMRDTNGWAKAGLMFRESLNANSRYAIAFMSPTNGTALQQRTSTGGSAAGVAGTAGPTVPYWLRLVRSGNTFTAYQSADGAAWTTLGTTTISMATNAYVGLAVSSHNDPVICQALFSNVSLNTSDSPQVTPQAGNGLVTLRWNSVPGATGYKVKRATSLEGPFTTVVSSTPGTAYVDTGLTDGTTYFHKVSALNGSSETADSAVVSATPTSSATLVSRATGGAALANAEKATESAAKAFDGSTSTKWYTDVNASTGWIQYQFGNGLAWRITEYKITSANDVPQRDPKDWEFQGSNNGTTWITLDTRTNQIFASRLQTNTYSLSNDTPYRYYRLNITANNGGSGFPIQISEFALLSAPSDPGDKTPPILSLPSDQVLNADNDTGMVVTFNASATDTVNGTLNVDCQPASGTLFPSGVTTVQCAATDLLANTAIGSFTITVNSPVMAWRLAHFGTSENAGNAADDTDPDGDGTSNLTEFRLGLDPKNGASRFAATADASAQLEWPGAEGITFTVLRSSTLAGNWEAIATVPGTAGTTRFTDPAPPANTAFYRIRLDP